MVAAAAFEQLGSTSSAALLNFMLGAANARGCTCLAASSAPHFQTQPQLLGKHIRADAHLRRCAPRAGTGRGRLGTGCLPPGPLPIFLRGEYWYSIPTSRLGACTSCRQRNSSAAHARRANRGPFGGPRRASHGLAAPPRADREPQGLATCPLSTGERTRRVHLVRGEGGSHLEPAAAQVVGERECHDAVGARHRRHHRQRGWQRRAGGQRRAMQHRARRTSRPHPCPSKRARAAGGLRRPCRTRACGSALQPRRRGPWRTWRGRARGRSSRRSQRLRAQPRASAGARGRGARGKTASPRRLRPVRCGGKGGDPPVSG